MLEVCKESDKNYNMKIENNKKKEIDFEKEEKFF
jgi:hypothetical protein